MTANLTKPRAHRALWLVWMVLQAWLALLMSFSLAQAASFPSTRHFTRLAESDGLPREHVTAFAQDKQGMLWIGTQAGLSRFDGYRVTTYRHVAGQVNSLADNWIQALLADEQGVLWIGTRRGLQKFRPGSDDFEAVNLPPSTTGARGPTQINALTADGTAGLWVASHEGLHHLTLATGVVTSFRHHAARVDSLSHDKVLALHRDAKGHLWVGTQVGVDVLYAGKQAFKHWQPLTGVRDPISLDSVRLLTLDADRTLWVVSEAGLQAWSLNDGDQAVERVYAMPRHINDAFIVPYVDRQNRLWLGTETAGLGQWDARQRRFLMQAHQAEDSHGVPKHISALFHDRTGSLWLGTWASGAYRTDLDSGGFSKFVSAQGSSNLEDHRVFSITSHGDGRLWLSTYEDIALLDPTTGQAQNHKLRGNERETMNVADVRVSVRDAAARQWVMRHADPKTGQLRLPTLDQGRLLSNVVRHVVSDRRGRMWLASRSGLHRIDPATGLQRNYHYDPRQARSLSDDVVRYVLVDRDGEVWVATDQGLDRYDEKRDDFTRYQANQQEGEGLNNSRIQYLHEDRAGRIWVGTAEGLAWLVKQADATVRIHRLPGKQGAAVDPIGGILEDERGQLWVSTTSGVTQLDPDSLQMRFFTSKDGMIEGFYFAQSAHVDEQGRMYFGGLNGLTAFHPAEIRSNPHAPSVVLTGVRVNNEELMPGKTVQGIKIQQALASLTHLVLDHDHQTLTVEFAALHFADPLRNSYRYRLEGQDKDWITATATQRTVTYTNLTPGPYVLQVQASNKDDVWSREALRLHIEVRPAYWQSWWFRSLVVSVVMALLWSLYQWRVRALTRRQIALESAVAAGTAELRQQKEWVEQAHRNMSSLSEVGRRITATLDLDRIHSTLFEQVRELLPLDGFALGILDESEQVLLFPQVHHVGGETSTSRLSLDDEARAEIGCLKRQSCELLAAEGDAVLPLVAGDARSAMLVTLAVDGRVLGLMVAQSNQAQAYEPWHRDLFATLGAYCAIALDNAQTFRQLRHTQDELIQQQKFATLGSLVAGVSHELNTPMGISLTVASTMMDKAETFAGRLSGETPLRKSDLKTFVDEMKQGADLLMRSLTKGTELVASFKAVAVDRSSAKRRHFELHSVAKDVAEVLGNDIHLKGHELQLDVPEGIEMDAYPGPLGQVLTNLINNAMLHGFQGQRGGKMALSAGLIGGDRVRIVFRDNGVGIPAHHMPKIFDPFFTTKLGQGGSGLGLSICFNMVHAVLGGELNVSSTEGEGTTFTVDLPLVAPQQDAEYDPYA